MRSQLPEGDETLCRDPSAVVRFLSLTSNSFSINQKDGMLNENFNR